MASHPFDLQDEQIEYLKRQFPETRKNANQEAIDTQQGINTEVLPKVATSQPTQQTR
jgi:hypothetical protein